MIRNTSAMAYHAIKANGLLSRMRWLVYDCLYQHGPLTGNEVNERLKSPGQVAPSYHKRLSELETLGVVRTIGVRACSVTGRECEEWDVTSNLPTGSVSNAGARPTKAQMKSAVRELRAIHNNLQRQRGRGLSPDTVAVCQWLHARSK